MIKIEMSVLFFSIKWKQFGGGMIKLFSEFQKLNKFGKLKSMNCCFQNSNSSIFICLWFVCYSFNFNFYIYIFLNSNKLVNELKIML